MRDVLEIARLGQINDNLVDELHRLWKAEQPLNWIKIRKVERKLERVRNKMHALRLEAVA